MNSTITALGAYYSLGPVQLFGTKTSDRKKYPIMPSLKFLILISLFQYGQSVTLTLSELEDWKNQMRAELKLEIKTEMYQELPETEDMTRMNTKLNNFEKTSQEIITAVQDHGAQLEELTLEVHNHTTQIENLGTESQETNGLVEHHSNKINELDFNQNETKSIVENQSTDLNRFENDWIGLNETLQEYYGALNHSIIAKANEFQKFLTDIKLMHSEDKVESIGNMTEMKTEIVGSFEDQTKALQESETSLTKIIALQASEFHRLLKEIKENQNKDQLELTSNQGMR